MRSEVELVEVTGGATIRDYAWAALAAVIAGFGALSLTASLVVLLQGDVGVLIGAPICLLFTYWIGMGAWRRTLWGRPQPGADVAGPPELPADRARRFILLAGACGIALALALGVQVLVGRS
ncbi:MAG: hypothetical protein M3144_12905 [Actinomycetota bacterium]|nr:hypothetical protein [Actinomycetota bacterium]